MPANDIARWMTGLLDELEVNRQRQLVSLQGPREWCDAGLAALREMEPAARLISDRFAETEAVALDKAAACLGDEARLVVLDLFDGFDPDLLCIAGGLVRAGGVLVLMSPPPKAWEIERDRYACWQDGRRSARAYFVEYFFAAMRGQADIGLRLTPRSLPRRSPLPPLQPTPLQDGCTPEQAQVLEQLQAWLRGRQRGIALLSAARGRGKSTCLGMLAKRLSAEWPLLVSARSRQAAAVLLRQCPTADFVAPDRLLRERPMARLLIVDEAAAIPLSLLNQLCRQYPLLAMATTSGGYEGTGQGFMLRFVAQLDAHDLSCYRLEDPVRWCNGDRLEHWLDECLMQNPRTVIGDSENLPLDGCRLRVVENPGAPRQRPLLREIYALLCSAHYRSRPSDLRMLMENPDQLLIAARLRGRVIGVALLNIEGGFDAALAEDVFLGRRRPRGHLLAQMLTAQAGCRGFALHCGLRVQRIAVDPAYRRQGLGSRLLERARRVGAELGLDYLGASFALDAGAVNFWRRTGFRLVHVSYAPGKSSGMNSVAVLQPIGVAAQPALERLQARVQQQLPTWMTQFLQTLDADQIAALLRLAEYRSMGGEQEQHEIEAFTAGNRGFELCFASLQKYVMQRIAQREDEPDALLIEKAVQNLAWAECSRSGGDEGRKQLQKRLRGLVDALDKAC